MAKKFSELRNKMSLAARAEVDREVKRLVAEMPLYKLREARHLTQTTLAKTLEVSQSEVSKIERRTDVYVSTLGSYIEAMGGRLEISAVFPDGGVVKINQFEMKESDEARSRT
jgi:transcriptional regulator with XRE-family HTH domain